MGRLPVEHPPDKWRGELEGLYINHTGRPDIPVMVRVHWSDGTESEHIGATGQWTKSHCYVRFDDMPSMWVRASAVRRRDA